MKRYFSVFLYFLCIYACLLPAPAAAQLGYNRDVLYGKPAEVLGACLPLSDGNTGAHVSGGIRRETIALNDATWCSGRGDSSTISPFVEGPTHLYIDLKHKTQDIWGYNRYLDLQRATARTEYSIQRYRYIREYFFPPKQYGVMAIRMTCSHRRMLDFTLHLHNRSSSRDSVFFTPEQYCLISTENTGPRGRRLQGTLVRIVSHSGILFQTDTAIGLAGATVAVLLTATGTVSATDTLTHAQRVQKLYQMLNNRLDKAAKKGWAELYKAHWKQYRTPYKSGHIRVYSRLQEREEITGILTALEDRLSDYYDEQPDIALEALGFNYGRYLLLSHYGISDPPYWSRDTCHETAQFAPTGPYRQQLAQLAFRDMLHFLPYPDEWHYPQQAPEKKLYRAITEVSGLFVRACEDQIYLLPALPDNWWGGFLRDIPVGNNLRVNIQWFNGRIVSGDVSGAYNGTLTLHFQGTQQAIEVRDGVRTYFSF
jgi:hypothetical protein